MILSLPGAAGVFVRSGLSRGWQLLHVYTAVKLKKRFRGNKGTYILPTASNVKYFPCRAKKAKGQHSPNTITFLLQQLRKHEIAPFVILIFAVFFPTLVDK